MAPPPFTSRCGSGVAAAPHILLLRASDGVRRAGIVNVPKKPRHSHNVARFCSHYRDAMTRPQAAPQPSTSRARARRRATSRATSRAKSWGAPGPQRSLMRTVETQPINVTKHLLRDDGQTHHGGCSPPCRTLNAAKGDEAERENVFSISVTERRNDKYPK